MPHNSITSELYRVVQGWWEGAFPRDALCRGGCRWLLALSLPSPARVAELEAERAQGSSRRRG